MPFSVLALTAQIFKSDFNVIEVYKVEESLR